MTHKSLRFPKAETKEQWLKDREKYRWEVWCGHTPENFVFVSRCKNHDEAIQTVIRDSAVQDRMKMGFSLTNGIYSSEIKGTWERVVPVFNRKYWLRPFGYTGFIHQRW